MRPSTHARRSAPRARADNADYVNPRDALTWKNAVPEALRHVVVCKAAGISPAGYTRVVVGVLVELGNLHGESDERNCEQAAQRIITAELVAARKVNAEAIVGYLVRAQRVLGDAMMRRDLDEPIPFRLAGA